MSAEIVRVSVQIVTWNSADVIDACLESLLRQTSRHFEVIVVDNASDDGSADRAERWAGPLLSVTVRRETRNRGFCAAQNHATRAGSGDLCLFLNPDTELPPTFIADAIEAADRLPSRVGTIAPCILLPDGRIDSTGLLMDRFRRARDRDHGAPHDRRFMARTEVFGCTGAAALHRRAMLDDVAIDGRPLDEQLFAYYDDLDLAWRAGLRGWTCRYVSSLTVRHHRQARNSLRGLAGRPTRAADQTFSIRNRLLVMIKCDTLRQLILALPWLVPFEIARIGFLALRAPATLRAYRQAISAVPQAWHDRNRVHQAAVAAPLPPLPWRIR
jgi:GT2 family glycosyltransferase